MTSNYNRRGLVLAAMAALTTFMMPGSATADEPFKIGLILPMSGPFASTGKEIAAAVRVYQKKYGDNVAGRKVEIILKDDGGLQPDVTKRLARKTGRSTETIRYTLKQFDRDHPEAAIFPDNQGPLQLDSKRKIYQQYQHGESVETLAKRFCRTRTSIYRIISEMRAQRIMDLPFEHIPNETFARVRSHKREDRIIGPVPESALPVKKSRMPSDLPPYLASLYEVPLLTRKQEAFLFRKMNYLKYKAGKLRSKLDPARPKRRLDLSTPLIPPAGRKLGMTNEEIYELIEFP